MRGHQTYHFLFCFDLMNLKQMCDPSIMMLCCCELLNTQLPQRILLMVAYTPFVKKNIIAIFVGSKPY